MENSYDDDGSSTGSNSYLEDLRKKIDRTDRALLASLIERFRLAEEVGRYKSRKGTASFDQQREAEIVRRAHRLAEKAKIPREGFERIIRAVIDYCRTAVQNSSGEISSEVLGGDDSSDAGKSKVAFPGEKGAFSEVAGTLMKPGCVLVPCRGFMEVVQKVEQEEADFGVLPVENTIAGGVTSAYESVVQGSVQVVGEGVIPINLQLVGTENANVELAREVWSHPMALGQCKRFFQQRRHLSAVEVNDTAGAAREVATLGDDSILAICSETAAQLYDLKIVASDIQDRSDNQTRFFLVSKGEDRRELQNQSNQIIGDLAQSGELYKTVLTVETANRAGSLRDLLNGLAEEGYDLAYLESKPTGVPWTYRFFLEVKHFREEETERVQELLLAFATRIMVVGVFRVGT